MSSDEKVIYTPITSLVMYGWRRVEGNINSSNMYQLVVGGYPSDMKKLAESGEKPNLAAGPYTGLHGLKYMGVFSGDQGLVLPHSINLSVKSPVPLFGKSRKKEPEPELLESFLQIYDSEADTIAAANFYNGKFEKGFTTRGSNSSVQEWKKAMDDYFGAPVGTDLGGLVRYSDLPIFYLTRFMELL